MTESRIKRLWKNRISHQLTGLQFSTCLSKVDSNNTEKYNSNATVIQSPPPTPPSHSINSPNKLWRKPLPDDCPVFDFDNTPEKIIYTTVTTASDPVTIMDEKTEIPMRCASRHYENIPNLEAQLDRACTNEKAVLLTKLLQKKYNQQRQ